MQSLFPAQGYKLWHKAVQFAVVKEVISKIPGGGSKKKEGNAGVELPPGECMQFRQVKMNNLIRTNIAPVFYSLH